MMQPSPKPIRLTRGDFYELYMRIRERVWDEGSQSWVPGAYRDLTGWSGQAQMRRTYDDPDVLATFDVVLDDQTQPDTVGGVFVRLEDAVTATLPVTDDKNRWVWDLEMIDLAGKPATYLQGSVTVKPDVTR
jgi:hypothetical protein